MYRMLVKVFNTGEQSHFVLRAALVAWGLHFTQYDQMSHLGLLLQYSQHEACVCSRSGYD